METEKEKLLCKDKCKIEKFSFARGVNINDECPDNCSVQELQGKHFKGSRAAQEEFNKSKDIASYAQ